MRSQIAGCRVGRRTAGAVHPFMPTTVHGLDDLRMIVMQHRASACRSGAEHNPRATPLLEPLRAMSLSSPRDVLIPRHSRNEHTNRRRRDDLNGPAGTLTFTALPRENHGGMDALASASRLCLTYPDVAGRSLDDIWAPPAGNLRC